jgi:hypothetical protein
MGDPLVDIELELRRGTTPEHANDHRERLKDSFAKLSHDQAASLMNRLFTPNPSRLQLDFRRLSRGVRLELLLRLTMALDLASRANFLDELTREKNTSLKQGLRVIFPDYTKTQRDQFLQELAKPPSNGIPLVKLVFRNQGKFSTDNKARLLPAVNNLGPLPGDGHNQMEIQGIVHFHHAGVEYRFDRTISEKVWFQAEGHWTVVETKINVNDNKTTGDEDDSHPDNGHIYSIDDPGLEWQAGSTPQILSRVRVPGDRDRVTDVVKMMNATERVEVQLGKGPLKEVARLDWFTVTWLERVGATWRRKDGWNMIEAGSLGGLDDNDSTPDTVTPAVTP